MSIWAHANGTIMLDGFAFKEDDIEKDIEIIKNEILGSVIHYGEMGPFGNTIMPCGSEGSLDYRIDTCSEYVVITICGNLRDYEDISQLEKWYKKVLEDIEENTLFYVREHVFQARVEGSSQVIIFKKQDDNKLYETIKEECND